MAQVRPFGQPQNDGERRLIAILRDRLPKEYTIIGNPEIRLGHQVFEVDAVVLAPHAIYLLDAKGTGGDITVQGGRWFPRNHEPFLSPVAKIRDHAKKLKGEIERADPRRSQDLRAVWVEGLVVLVSPGARIVADTTRTDSEQVVGIGDIVDRLQDATSLPPWARPIGPVYKVIERQLLGAARNPGQTRLGKWVVDEPLGGTETYDDFRAQDSALGMRAGSVRLRVYRLDPYLTGPEREKQRHLITNAYEALARLPSHTGIIAARDFFPRDGDPEQAAEWVLVSEDIPGTALRLHLDDPGLALTWDQKLVIAEELLAALAHCHAHAVVHRDLTPAAVLITPDGHAKLTAFDHSRPRPGRSDTIAGELRALLDPNYQAPECGDDPGKASPASDVFSLGVLLYECFAGERPWNGRDERDRLRCVFPRTLAAPRPDLGWLHDWLVGLCAASPDDRPTAADALDRFQAHLDPTERHATAVTVELDYANLAKGTQIGKYQIEERLGKPGGFAVAYKALDIDADTPRVLKLVLKDRLSVLDRFRGEYRKLANLPEHPRVVRVLHGDVLPAGGPPYLVFPFVDAFDIQELITDRAITADESLNMARQVAEGLIHLHRHDLYHCDIKPRNLLLTDHGALIIDFNVAVFGSEADHGGGQHRYLPPDYDTSTDPTPADLADRDTFALALSLYEALTDGGYPWEGDAPARGVQPRDPRGVRTRRGKINGNARLSQPLVDVVLHALHPHRAQRYAAAADLLAALQRVDRALVPETTAAVIGTPATVGKPGSPAVPMGAVAQTPAPDTNPFVTLLATLYSQSTLTNCGTRGLDAGTEALYVPTNLDRVLGPAVLERRFRLVVITGNAGDGKTAFLQRLEQTAVQRGALRESTATGAKLRFGATAAESATAVPNPTRTAGGRVNYDGVTEPTTGSWTLITNHDGSQDAGAEANDAVLQAFFAPYRGETAAQWPNHETRLIAINEGRLLDFLQHHAGDYPLLSRLLRSGLDDDQPQNGVTVVNLTRRAVIATDGDGQSIVTRLIEGFTTNERWQACETCRLKDRCYARHNALTLRAPTSGTLVKERIQHAFTLVHLQNALHLTMRDVRSALAFTLTSGRTCAQIHALYEQGEQAAVIGGFYFNAWLGGSDPHDGSGGSVDRLLTALGTLDPAAASDPSLDRRLDYILAGQPDAARLSFPDRPAYDDAMLRSLHETVQAGEPTAKRMSVHQRLVGWLRRRWFFERRDDNWWDMLPYRSARRLTELVDNIVTLDAPALTLELVQSINRGEGLADPDRLGRALVLRVKGHDKARLRSYRTFPVTDFTIELAGHHARDGAVESMPSGLLLRHRQMAGAQLRIGLDLFELLTRLGVGYWPSVEQRHGRLHELSVFKNVLGSAPYQRILLTNDGHDFYSITRSPDGILTMDRVTQEVGSHA